MLYRWTMKATTMLNFKNIRISRTLHDIKSKCCTHINVATPFLKIQDGDDRLFSHLRNGQRCCVLTEFGLRKNKFILDHLGRPLLMLAIFNITTIYFTSHIFETAIVFSCCIFSFLFSFVFYYYWVILICLIVLYAYSWHVSGASRRLPFVLK